MPLAPNFAWEETEQAVEVRVSLPGASRAKSDVFATDSMLKVNSSPYLLILDLHADVEDALSAATLTADGVKFKLVKKAPGLWGRLTREASSKEEVLARRNASIDRAHKRLEEARLARLDRKQRDDKAAVDRQIELERRKRLEIDRRKGAELDAERGGIQAWQQQLQQQQLQQQQGNESDYESDDEGEHVGAEGGSDVVGGRHKEQGVRAPMPDHEQYHGKGWRPSATRSRQGAQDVTDQGTADDSASGSSSSDEDAAHIRQRDRSSTKPRSRGAGSKQHAPTSDTWASVQQQQQQQPRIRDEEFKPLPPPRMRLEPVRVEFTKLETPHLPARAQREEELRTYKQKMVDDKKLLADSQDVADRQPVFLKDKGDTLYKQGNYRGALNAYSRAVELDGAIPLVWANRGACHLALGSWESAMGDCTRALDLLLMRQDRFESGSMDASDGAAYRRQLVRVRVRRGQAYAQMGAVEFALQDYEQALKMDPGNSSLASDVEELRAALAPADASVLRQRGAARFASGDHAGAVEAWSLLLSLPRSVVPEPEQQAALSNRAAAFLVLGRYAEGESDCGRALALALAALHSKVSQQTMQEQQKQQQQGSADGAPPAGSSNCKSVRCNDGQGDAGADCGRSGHSVQGASPCTDSGAGQPTIPNSIDSGDLHLLHAAAAAAATATQGPLAHTAASVEAVETALHAYAHSLLQQQGAQNGVGECVTLTQSSGGQDGDEQQQQQSQQQGQQQQGQQQQQQQSGQPIRMGEQQQQQQQQQQQSQQQQQQSGQPSVASLLASVARLLARRGALRGHMRQYSSAHADCQLASKLFQVLQDTAKAGQLAADAHVLGSLLAEQQGREEAGMKKAPGQEQLEADTLADCVED